MSGADVDFPSDLRSLESEYELVRELGQGGMAAVYLARHRASDRVVAIKAVRARYLDDPDAIKRFAREARTVAKLDHPNIVRTEAIRQIDDRAVAIIMEHIPGGTVRDRLREFGSLGAEDAEWILRDAANALGYAHRQGIVHRDVKPENIFLDATRRRALLSDFGIARTIDTESGITLLGAALGTPQYMSPEQIDGEQVDGRSDIYSLGVLGWELLTGRRPWAGESLYGVIYKQKHEDLARITSLRPRVPANLLFAIEGALLKDKARRWQTIDEFLDQLTYNPPPLLAQTYPPGSAKGEYAPTVQFRPAAQRADEPPGSEPVADVVDTKLREEAATLFAPDPALALLARDAVDRGASITVATPSDAIAAAAFPGSEYTLPEYDPNAEPPYDPIARRRRIVQIVGLTVPLGVAAASLFAMLGGSTTQSTTRTSMQVTASARTVAADSALAPRSISAVLTSAPPAALDTSLVVQPPSEIKSGDTMTARRSVVAERPNAKQPARHSSGNSRKRGGGAAATSSQAREGQGARAESVRVAAGRPADSNHTNTGRANGNGGARDSTAPLEDPFRPPEPAPAPKTLGKGEVPTPACRVASVADQHACLDAYIAIGDAPMNKALGTLVEEFRRVSKTPLGVADPPTAQRLRVEQQAWIAVRENECPRHATAGIGPLWAQDAATCFNKMSSARAAELRDAVKRLRRKR